MVNIFLSMAMQCSKILTLPLILPVLIKTSFLTGNFAPKTTILELLNDADVARNFNQQFINVTWCLFPSVPLSGKTSFYIKVSNHNNVSRLIKAFLYNIPR